MSTFQKGAGENVLVYPVTQEQIDNLKPCRLVNPKVGDNHGYKMPDNFCYDEGLREILDVRLDVTNGVFPHWFLEKHYPFKDFEYKARMPKPLMNEGLSLDDPQGCADVVRMDLPSQMPNAVLRYLLTEGYNVQDWTPNHINFLESVPYVQEQITDGIKRGLNKAFEIKYALGIARPEEICAERLKLNGNITAYGEGCPNHPATPAGHASAAAGGVASALGEFEKLKSMTLQEVLDSAYHWAMYRTFAGVHYRQDNILGLIANGFKKYIKKDIIDLYTL